jgi:hypothetical protein
MSYEDLIAAWATRQENGAAKEAARERKMKNSKRKIMNDAEIADTPFDAITAAHSSGTEAEPAVFGVWAQTKANMFGEAPFRVPVARMYWYQVLRMQNSFAIILHRLVASSASQTIHENQYAPSGRQIA